MIKKTDNIKKPNLYFNEFQLLVIENALIHYYNTGEIKGNKPYIVKIKNMISNEIHRRNLWFYNVYKK